MTLEIGKTSDSTFSRVRWMLHGDSGSGKTYAINTLPIKETLVIGAERSLMPIRELDFDAWKVAEWPDIREAIVKLRKGEDCDEKKIIVFDSLSAIAEICAHHIVHVDRKALISERTRGQKTDPTGVYSDNMTQEDYGLLATRIKAFVSAAVNLPYTVIFTSLSDWKENKVTGESVKLPLLSGKLAFSIPAYFDVVAHQEVVTDADGNEVRQWRTAKSEGVFAKDATDKLDAIEEPDYTKAFKKIFGGKK